MNDYIVELHCNREINTKMQYKISSWIFVSYNNTNWHSLTRFSQVTKRYCQKVKTGTQNGGIIQHNNSGLQYVEIIVQKEEFGNGLLGTSLLILVLRSSWVSYLNQDITVLLCSCQENIVNSLLYLKQLKLMIRALKYYMLWKLKHIIKC